MLFYEQSRNSLRRRKFLSRILDCLLKIGNSLPYSILPTYGQKKRNRPDLAYSLVYRICRFRNGRGNQGQRLNMFTPQIN